MMTDMNRASNDDILDFGLPRSRFPETCKGVDIVIGVDEAGRGCVLGSLIYCAAFWPVSEHETICKLGFDDSKQLKESERDSFFDTIVGHPSIGYVIEELSAPFLSEEMMKASPTSLNQISYDGVIRMLAKIRDAEPTPPNITDVYIDTVGDPETYKNRLVRGLGADYGRFTIEKKADATYKVVGAASIIAKVTRDKLLAGFTWEEAGVTYDKKFGSGYPGDEHCVHWLERSQDRIFGYPSLVRFSWSTCREALIKGGAVKVAWECDEDANADAVGTPQISSFFNAVGEKRVKRTLFFVQKKLKHILPADLDM